MKITDRVNGAGAWRFAFSERYWPSCNKIYRDVFEYLGNPLLEGTQVLPRTADNPEGKVDTYLGIDVILRHRDGSESTLQEKILRKYPGRVTVEHMNDWIELDKGDWYTLKAQYYFVANTSEGNNEITDWILLDWLRLKTMSVRRLVPWRLANNTSDGARASFMHVPFDAVPDECVVARHNWTRGLWR